MSHRLARGMAALAILLLLGVGVLCTTQQVAPSTNVLTHQLCVGVHGGRLWVVWQSPIRSAVPEVMRQPGTRCLRVPSGPFLYTAGEISFPP